MKSNIKLMGVLLVLFPSCLLISSCGNNLDLRAAENYGLMAAELEDKTTKLANDIYDSCIRKVRYFRLQARGSDEIQKQALEDCEALNKPTAQKTKTANQVLINYMIAVGKLASDNTVKFNESLDNIKQSLNGLNVDGVALQSQAVTSGLNIAGFFLDWVTSESRRGNLREAIVCTDDSIQNYNKGLILVFQEGYINGILSQENNQIRQYYESYAAVMRTRNADDREFRALEQEKFQAIDTVIKRRDAALSYIEFVNITAQTHNALKDVFSKEEDVSNQTQLTARCEQYFGLASNNTVSKNSPLTPLELKEVNKIMLKYERKITPLLKKMKLSLY